MKPEEPDDRIDEIFAELLRATDAGTSISREDFLQRYPDLRHQLTELLDAADLIDELSASGDAFATNLPSLPDEVHPSSSPFVAATDHSAIAETPTQSIAINPLQRAFEETLPPPSSANAPHPHASTGNSPDRAAAGNASPSGDRLAESSELRLPYRFGEFVLERVLGRGGMGVVYLARQLNLDRQVALKMIRSGALASSEEVKRFYAEARASAKLQHPSIVTVFQCGQLEGQHYFAMEYVPGSDLAKRIAQGPLSPDQSARYVTDVARAIHYAHGQGLLHRDLKPANVLLDQHDRVRVTDFGLAKQIDSNDGLTKSGTAVGTPSYMAPEQARGEGEELSPATDVYSLGAVLYASLTGKPPFVGESILQTLLQVSHKPAPRVRQRRPEVSRDMDTIIAKCLEKDPKRRYPSAGQLADDLQRHLDGRPIIARGQTAFGRWLQNVQRIPLVAAVAGHRIVQISDQQRRAQWLVLTLAAMIPLLAGIFIPTARWWSNRLPSQVVLGGGWSGGSYQAIADGMAARIGQSTGCDISVLSSAGSFDNRQKLIDGKIDMALLQATALRGDQLSVIAPVFHEAVHFLVRRDRNIQSFDDLTGKVLACGPASSGSRLAADMLLEAKGLTGDTIARNEKPWDEVIDDPTVDAAILCVGRGSTMVRRMLSEGNFQLLEIPDATTFAIEHPTMTVLDIRRTDYPNNDVPPRIQTVGTTAFLVARSDAPNALVRASLEALYATPSIAPGMLPFSAAAEWPGLALHPAAKGYFTERMAANERGQ
jgi:eukaryotic-like serine/threonine-protein kinase